MKIKKGDPVQVIAGKDKGKSGVVYKSLPKIDRVIIEGVNVATKHMKNRRSRSHGQVIEKSMPLHISNVSLVEDKKPVRVGYKIEGEGKEAKKVRISRKTGKEI